MELLCALNTDKWTDYPTDRSGNRPGIQGKLLVKHVQVVKQAFCPSPFSLWWMHSFSHVRGFPAKFFTRLCVLRRHPRILGFTLFFYPLLLSVAVLDVSFFYIFYVPLHLPYEGKCQNNGRDGPETTIPEMTATRVSEQQPG